MSAPTRRGASRADTVALWHKVSTVEDPRWTERYHAKEHEKLAFGGRIVIRMKDGSVLADELAVANAHPLGETPLKRPNYVGKFHEMTAGLIDPDEGHARGVVILGKREVPIAEIAKVEVRAGRASWWSSGKVERAVAHRIVVVRHAGDAVPATKEFRRGPIESHQIAREALLAAIASKPAP